ncbi:MAG TPA: hypothetical protein RMH99_13960 [Sandaracinaceae bacterium LLY-WYZ-13_1]|nr:hypothetical protein [Sandaracinaceae bacterium LLY-WYZ-13_1]
MGRIVRDGSGLVLVLAALAALFFGVSQLREHDYLAAALMLLTGLAVLRAGVELLRPTIGE